LGLLLGQSSIRAQAPYGLPNIKTAADAVVTFNEIMYQSVDDDPSTEWLELYNQMSIDIELSNWRIEGGIEFQFPTNAIIAANGYVVVAIVREKLTNALIVTNLYGPFAQRLSNSGDKLRLLNHNRRLMDEMEFGDTEPWPVAADGSGASLSKRGRFMASSRGENWRASTTEGGTPGRVNFTSATVEPSSLAFHEIGAGLSGSFFVELINRGSTTASTEGYRIVSRAGPQFALPVMTLEPGAVGAFTEAELGFTPPHGEALFLKGPELAVLDGVEVNVRTRAKLGPAENAAWGYPETPTPGEPNQVSLHREIVINEIMYHHAPHYSTNAAEFVERDEQWIELYNRSALTVDLSGWQLEDEIEFVFPAQSIVLAGGYLVVANDAATLRAKYPDITIIGDFRGRISHHAGKIVLRDAQRNPADEVSYFNEHPWPSYANGGGSTLELRNPDMDNSVAAAWADSLESGKSTWRRYTYRARAIRPVYTPSIFNFHEFRMGLLSDGEALIDNITVTEFPTTGGPRQLLQNTNFTEGVRAWRLLGTHSHTYVEPRADNAADNALHLVATGPMSYMDNRLETSLKFAGALVPVTTGRDYEISFDAKWVAGSPQLKTELYYNKVTAVTILDMPEKYGTPGRRNSTWLANAGPTYTRLEHSPVIPKNFETINVRVHAEDPDGIASMTLFYAVNGGTWRTLDMPPVAPQSADYAAAISPQINNAIIQFYVEGKDKLGAASTYPPAGPKSRALIKVDGTSRVTPGKQTFRMIMTSADSSRLHASTNQMSDDLLGCTVVHDEREVFYDAKMRMHGSMFSRVTPSNTGFTIKLPADHLFRGSRASVIVRRRGLVETFIKHILNQVGGLPANYDDIVYLVSHRADNIGTARLNLANYDDTYVDSQFGGDNDGTVFKLEGIREFQATHNNDPEGYKLPMPIGWIQSFDIANLGNDKEQYRWGIMIQSERRRDDYSQIIAMGKALSLSGNALRDAAERVIDVDEWARLFALQNLTGIGDVYGVENPHNFAFYVRPSDGRVVGLQNDWEFAFSRGATASIFGGQNVYKMLRLPGFRRLYYGHLLDMVNTVYNSPYLTRWARHFSTLTGENYNAYPGYATQRGTSVKSQIGAKFPFEITTNGGADFPVETSTVTLEGRAWFDAQRLRLAGETNALPVYWVDDQKWQMTFPLHHGANTLAIEGYTFHGTKVGEDTITVTTTASNFPQRDYLRIAELMYHPHDPNEAELGAGFGDSDDFEFIEIVNVGPGEVSLAGVKLLKAVTFDFTGSDITRLGPSERLLVVKNRAAAALRYGAELKIAGSYSGSLNNAGEVVRLEDATGVAIQEFAYFDDGDWPAEADGLGPSLEVVNFEGDVMSPANWRLSSERGGSPGREGLARPSITSVSYAGGQVTLRFPVAANRGCTIHWRESLASGAWQILKSVPAQAQDRIEEIVDAPANATRFYRLSTP